MADFAAARRYARAGFPVLLVWGLKDGVCLCSSGKNCRTPGKHPMQIAWERNATTDLEKLKSWCRKNPDAHLGIMPKKGTVIIDVDPRNGGTETLKEKMNGHKLPWTPVQRSGGGGMHIVLRGDVGALGNGIDVKRPGRGYVVAAPADHISGGKYRWERSIWEQAIADVPEFLHEKDGKRDEQHGPPPSVPLETVRNALSYVNADDYHRWINFGIALRYSYGEDGEEAWAEWSKTSPKWIEEHREKKWHTFNLNPSHSNPITIRTIMRIARQSGYRPLSQEFSRSMWVEGDVSDYIDKPAPPLFWAFEPYMAMGKVTTMCGAGGSSKSFLSLELAIRLALGQSMGQFKASSGAGKAMLLVAEEDRDDIHRRFKAILDSRRFSEKELETVKKNVTVVPVGDLDWRLMRYDEARNATETDRVDYLIDEIKAIPGIKYVVLDPMVEFNGLNENDNSEMAQFMRTLRRIAQKANVALVVIHHFSKGGENTGLREATQSVIRGATAIVNGGRASLLVMRIPRTEASNYRIHGIPLSPDEATRYIVVRMAKTNVGTSNVPDMILRVGKGGTLSLAPEVTRNEMDKMGRISGQQKSVLEFLRDYPDSGPAEMWKTLEPAWRLEGIAVEERTFRSRLTQMKQQDLIEADGLTSDRKYSITEKGLHLLKIPSVEVDEEDLIG